MNSGNTACLFDILVSAEKLRALGRQFMLNFPIWSARCCLFVTAL
jgi:hypothetical protein